MPSSAGSVFKPQEVITMFRNLVVTTTLMSFTLFAAPSMSSSDNQPSQPDLENQVIGVARDGNIRKAESHALSSKRAEYSESNESVDCFYDANKFHSDCSGAKSGKR
jgi:hypothetical protein